MSFDIYLRTCQNRVNKALCSWLPDPYLAPHNLHQSINYVIECGGKRLRPTLIYATGEALKADSSILTELACAVELIHTYSLIHDDLPAMDNDDLRRGKATCHKAFGEATAILAGDTLQSLAFQILSAENSLLDPTACVQIINILAKACGANGMAGGQALDLAATNQEITLAELEEIHQRKTGALIQACVKMVAIAANCTDQYILEALSSFSQTFGLAFQVQDDILDVEGQTEIIGKQQGSDSAKNKATYPALLGLAAAREKLDELCEKALLLLKELPLDTKRLQELTIYAVKRDH